VPDRLGACRLAMPTTHYRDYRIWHDRTHQKFFAVIWPPGPPIAVLKILTATPREGQQVLMRKVRAFIDVEEARQRRSAANKAKA
jgi:hypothetical protein